MLPRHVSTSSYLHISISTRASTRPLTDCLQLTRLHPFTPSYLHISTYAYTSPQPLSLYTSVPTHEHARLQVSAPPSLHTSIPYRNTYIRSHLHAYMWASRLPSSRLHISIPHVTPKYLHLPTPTCFHASTCPPTLSASMPTCARRCRRVSTLLCLHTSNTSDK
jgi:hypothetical protein